MRALSLVWQEQQQLAQLIDHPCSIPRKMIASEREDLVCTAAAGPMASMPRRDAKVSCCAAAVGVFRLNPASHDNAPGVGIRDTMPVFGHEARLILARWDSLVHVPLFACSLMDMSFARD